LARQWGAESLAEAAGGHCDGNWGVEMGYGREWKGQEVMGNGGSK
jgi:hypothetical protein